MKTLVLFLAVWIAISGAPLRALDQNDTSFREVFERGKPGRPYARIRILRAVENPGIKGVPVFRAEVLEDFGSVVPLRKEIDFLLTEPYNAGSLAKKLVPGSEWLTALHLVHFEGQPVKELTGFLLGVTGHWGTLLAVKDGVVTGNILKTGRFPDEGDALESIPLGELRMMMKTWKQAAAPAR
ncbi:hypothetical protein OKA05_14130 [Luteolibacter arcticus]|uniref:Uncharacterized protein n=1 Tax=Luteolibacter arcticus TaxID=1581411 RepID=A0ABT3GJK0_9BACT|nr:hypothetical protein [Luteolibacter arcticus]MCW1923700.1 hypothetical protein [Luteolibacter arcticus]